MRIFLEADFAHEAAVDLIEAFARSCSSLLRGPTRWALIDEALEPMERWLMRFRAAGA